MYFIVEATDLIIEFNNFLVPSIALWNSFHELFNYFLSFFLSGFFIAFKLSFHFYIRFPLFGSLHAV